MADKTKTEKLEREYIIPLRNEWRRVANYRRTGRAVKAIKQFIAKHMKVPERDTDKVKLDVYLNNEVWFRGRKKPPAKIKVRAIKDGEFVRVELAEMPETVKFLKARHERKNKLSEKPAKVKEAVKEEKTAEEKKDEKEKEISVAEQHAKEAKAEAKAMKRTTKVKEPTYHRMALKK